MTPPPESPSTGPEQQPSQQQQPQEPQAPPAQAPQPAPRFGEYAPPGSEPQRYQGQPFQGQPFQGQPQQGQQPQPQYGHYGEPRQPGLYGAFPYPATTTAAAPLPGRKSRRGLAVGFGITGITLVVLLVVGTALAWVNRQHISDQLTVWNFTPSPAIEEYITRSTMSERGQFLFLASEPVVTSESSFNRTCGSHEEGSGIVGCYLPQSRTILLFDVTDERLDGIEEVIASHEMLHAAWDRMSADERGPIVPLLEAEAAKLADSDEFAERMAYYARAEPGERANELHSIIGTEVADLDPALEAHYAEYFTNRATLIDLHKRSNGVFEENTSKTEELVDELDSIRTRVDKDYARYKKGYKSLTDDIDSFNVRADSGSFTTQAQFDDERSDLIDRQGKLDDLYTTIQDRIDDYDSTRAELEKLNAEAAELNTSINITPYDETGVG